MSISVLIEVEDDGSVTVGTPPEESGVDGSRPAMGGMMSEEQSDKSFMQPVGSVDEALAKAKDILSGAQQPEGQAQGNMWDRVKRDRQMQRQPGGPMMGMKG